MQRKSSPPQLLLENQLCFSVYSAALGLGKVYRRLLKELGLTYPQYLVMLVLWEKDDLTVSEIGAKLFLNSATLTPLLKRLEALKLVTKERSRKDEREVHIRLAKKGRELRTKAEAVPTELFCAMQMPPAQLENLRNQMNDLRDRLLRSTDEITNLPEKAK